MLGFLLAASMQQHLFEFPEDRVTDPAKLARRTDGETSKKAAEELVASGRHLTQKQRVLVLVRRWPGSTSAELARCGGLDRYMVAKRLPDLLKDRLVRKGEVRTCQAHGNEAATWYPREQT